MRGGGGEGERERRRRRRRGVREEEEENERERKRERRRKERERERERRRKERERERERVSLIFSSLLSKDVRSIQSSSLKWTSLPRLWKKRPQPSDNLQSVPVPDQLILDAQELIAHHENSTRPLSR